jgi:hypothetical protein
MCTIAAPVEAIHINRWRRELVGAPTPSHRDRVTCSVILNLAVTFDR